MFDPEIWREVTGGEVANRVRRLTRVTPLVPAPVAGAAHRRRRLAEAGEPAAHRLVQAARRGGAAGGARARAGRAAQGHRRLGREPRPRRGAGGARLRRRGDRAGVGADARVQARRDRGARRQGRGRAARPTTRPRPRRAGAPTPIRAWCSCRRSTTTTSSPATAACWRARSWRSSPTCSRSSCRSAAAASPAASASRSCRAGSRSWAPRPKSNCAMRRSLDEGRAYTTYDGGPTLAEGLEGAVSERTFAMARDYFPEIALVQRARASAARSSTPTGRWASSARRRPRRRIAALLDDASAIRGRRTVVVVTRRQHRARSARSAAQRAPSPSRRLRSGHSFWASAAPATFGARERRAAQRVPGRAVAQLGARGRRRARGRGCRAGRPRTGTCPSAARCGSRCRCWRAPACGRDDGSSRPFSATWIDAGAVADLALHVAQAVGVPEARAADLAVAGDVAADALVVVLLADLDQRLPGLRVHGLLPERQRLLVAGAALRVADEVGAPRLARRRRRCVPQVDRGDLPVEMAHLGRDLLVARQAAAQRDQPVGEVAAGGRRGPGALEALPLVVERRRARAAWRRRRRGRRWRSTTRTSA